MLCIFEVSSAIDLRRSRTDANRLQIFVNGFFFNWFRIKRVFFGSSSLSVDNEFCSLFSIEKTSLTYVLTHLWHFLFILLHHSDLSLSLVRRKFHQVHFLTEPRCHLVLCWCTQFCYFHGNHRFSLSPFPSPSLFYHIRFVQYTSLRSLSSCRRINSLAFSRVLTPSACFFLFWSNVHQM